MAVAPLADLVAQALLLEQPVDLLRLVGEAVQLHVVVIGGGAAGDRTHQAGVELREQAHGLHRGSAHLGQALGVSAAPEQALVLDDGGLDVGIARQRRAQAQPEPLDRLLLGQAVVRQAILADDSRRLVDDATALCAHGTLAHWLARCRFGRI